MDRQNSPIIKNPDLAVSNKQRAKQIALLFGAFLIGAAFRLIRLGILPLSNFEAGYALQALAVARGESTIFGDQITYVGLTGVSLFLFSAENFVARLWPAFSGSLIVFIPYLYRKYIGYWPAVLAPFVLAVSPEMVGPSRLIGSPMMAMVFLVLAIGFFMGKKPLLTGICFGLGLMSGPGFWIGIVIIGASGVFSNVFLNLSESLLSHFNIKDKVFWTKLGLSFLATVLVVGTGFFMAPAALGGILLGLHQFLSGFGAQRLVPFGLIPFALIAYAAGALVLGLWGAVQGLLVKRKLDLFLSIWTLVAFVFILLYPSSRPEDIVWITFPLWMLAVRVVVFSWRKPASSKLVVALTAIFVIVLSASMLLGLRTLITPTLIQAQQASILLAFIGGVILLVAVILLVNYGWSEDVARTGLLIGAAVVLSTGMISVSVNSTGLGPEVPHELWQTGEEMLITNWLEVTIDRAMVWNARRRDPVDINVSGIDTPGLRWALRHYEQTEFVPFVPPQFQPGLLITDIGAFPEISNSYQGQGLVWARIVPWQELNPNEHLTWLIAREVPTFTSEIIFWVRTDLMPGGQFID